jgi:hypothetical protein
MVSKPAKVRVVRPAPAEAVFHERGVIRHVEDRDAGMIATTTPTQAHPIPTVEAITPIEPDAGPFPEERRDVGELAALIAGPGRSVDDRLLHGLEKTAAGIRWTMRKAEEHPSREGLRKQLQTALKAARYLRDQLTDTTFQRVLAASSEDDLDGDNQTYHGVGSLISRLDKALSAIPTGSSRHKHEPGTNSPHAVCALGVTFAWRDARGSLPPHTSRDPQEACRLLWSLAGGPLQGWSDNLAGWREHLRRAKEELEKGDHPEVERLFNPSTP